MKSFSDKAKSAEDSNSVSALSIVCDYYGKKADLKEMEAKNNYQVNWDDWSHLVTPGLVNKLKQKFNAIDQE